MPRFLFLLGAGLAGAALFHILRFVLTGTLEPALVPLVAGLVAWSVIVVAVTLPWAERNVPPGQRYGWLMGGQLSLVLAILDGSALWSLPGGLGKLALGFILLVPVVALTQVTSFALFSRAERDAWSRRPRAQAGQAPGLPNG
ncbi:hypothetical protein [Methylobacterium nonmethylotrophicum]|uniref:Uncharacterized protein n=1 Tax=Methylobacterium nonmethylotrophicum TaxID=1141884 RepID=A0A4Z0NLK9_9HYPH|nr:hypothetical protein [Methylobacterium nonmethylotrophicum]TGD96745.1 hypothetical protein EU555_22040 [Methylobacterium nonmethylotrophicum]